MSEDKAHNIAIGMESEKILKGLTGKKYIDVKPQHQEQNSSQKKADSGQNTRRRGTSRPKRQGS
jgi:hypothetical protein